MRATHRGQSEAGGEHGIDLAPMLDFVMNLLIFFIITTSFIKEPGITVTAEEAETAAYQESGNILIAIRENGDVWMDRRRVAMREIRPIVERMHVARAEDTVVVIPDRRAPAGVLGQVMDEVRLAGVTEIAVGARNPVQ
jgi:biopolymer transport protein ExbD